MTLPLGGVRAGGKAGRGSENKVPFVAAVSLDERGHPLYLKLNLVRGLTFNAIGKRARASLAPRTQLSSDGLACFAAVSDAGYLHAPMMVGSLKPRDLPELNT